MSTTLYWLQCGGCGGDSMSLLGLESPDLIELLGLLDIEVLWHPSLSNGSPSEHEKLTERMLSGHQQLDILCIEGAIIRGPGGTGMYDTIRGKPKKDLVAGLAKRARFVVAVGTCASFGGIGADGDVEATGVQYHKWDKGGFLGESFTTQGGLQVINLPGCPCHCDVVAGILTALISGYPIPLSQFDAPLEWYGMLVHQGCTRNEYHEYRVEEHDFGEVGCLFFHMGCHGPLAYGPCNKILWNQRSSKTRVGVPCFGCTRPDFPQSYPFYETQNIEGIPLQLPDGVDRAHYLAYKGMAAAAAPKRLKERKTKI
ncbi:MAG: NADH:ubiquinone oxidoreductase [Deltaproteobacteria bacterium]|nr:NADH:ubiquinone oxidoreductase [Deltaproteobacteria bacterium]